MRTIFVLVLVAAGLVASGCSGGSAPSSDVKSESQGAPLSEELSGLIDRPFTGDLNAMVSRRLIRAGVPFNRTFFFIDQGTPRGLSYEYLTRFEEQLNKSRKTGNLKVHVVMFPMPRDELIPALQAGKIDLVVAQLTVTPSRQLLVDFTKPTRDNVNEVVVTGPGVPAVAAIEDLSGREVFVRR